MYPYVKGFFMDQQKEELGDLFTSTIESQLDMEYYGLLEEGLKQGEGISLAQYWSLNEGQQFRFNKHYNIHGDRIKN
jgi:hypothetical protein